MQTPVVRARGISKFYDDVVALDGVDLDIAKSEIHGLVGPNGAGKTTLLGLLLGLSGVDSGTLEVLGSPVDRVHRTPDAVAGFVDGPGLYPALTARQNLVATARLRGDKQARSDVDAVLEDVGLTSVADERLRGFSLGMRQRLGLASALLTRPRLLLLDEPSNGLDPAGKQQVHRLLRRVAADGTAVVLSSHRMDDLEQLCSQVTVLSTGRAVFSGPIGKLATESGPVDHRLMTSDDKAARALAGAARGVRLVAPEATVHGDRGSGGRGGGSGRHADDDSPLVVRADTESLDALVLSLAGAGIAVRELTPVVSPLESAFLALTSDGDES